MFSLVLLRMDWYTLAKSVLPVPGGPYIRMFLYRPLFCLVLRVAMAMSLTRSSREGYARDKQNTADKKRYCIILFVLFNNYVISTVLSCLQC